MSKMLLTPPKFGFLFYLDFIFILVSSIGTISMVQFVTFNILPIPSSLGLLLFTSFAYMIRFGGKLNGFGYLIRKYKLFQIITILYVWELFQALLMGEDPSVITVKILFLISAYISCVYLLGITKKYGSIKYLIKPYCFYAIYIFITIVVLTLLILSGLVSPFTNLLDNNSLIADNYERGVLYYFPAFLSLVEREPSVFLDYLGLPMICGLSHEPQLNCFAVFPALILLMYFYSDNKKIIYVAFGMMLILCVLSTSFTAIICTFAVIFLHVLWSVLIHKRYANAIYFMLTLLAISVLFFILGYFDKFVALLTVKADFDNTGSSGSTSVGLLDYIVSSNSIIGHGIFGSLEDIKSNVKFGQSSMGYVSSILVLLFYTKMILVAYKNYISKNIFCHIVGLASIYFCLHSLKYGVILFKYNYLFFILFLLVCSDNIRSNIAHEQL